MVKAQAQQPARPKAAPLDPARQENVADKNDPRFAGPPCHRQHEATTVISNQYGEITECSMCALRLKYVPRVGCTGRYRQKERLPVHVNAAIQAMRAEGIPFTNKTVKAMLDRVDADVRLQGAVPKQPQPPPQPQQHRSCGWRRLARHRHRSTKAAITCPVRQRRVPDRTLGPWRPPSTSTCRHHRRLPEPTIETEMRR